MSETGRPPRLARRLIGRALPEDRRDDITGDLDELFRRRSHERGRLRAGLWYWREALTFSGRFLAERFREGSRRQVSSDELAPGRISKRVRLPFGFSSLDLKLGFRMLAKQPLVTAVAGLALGLQCPVQAFFVAAEHDERDSLARHECPQYRVSGTEAHGFVMGDDGFLSASRHPKTVGASEMRICIAGRKSDRDITLRNRRFVLPMEGIDGSKSNVGKGIVFIQLHGGFAGVERARHFGIAIGCESQDDRVIEGQSKPRIRR